MNNRYNKLDDPQIHFAKWKKNQEQKSTYHIDCIYMTFWKTAKL